MHVEGGLISSDIDLGKTLVSEMQWGGKDGLQYAIVYNVTIQPPLRPKLTNDCQVILVRLEIGSKK